MLRRLALNNRLRTSPDTSRPAAMKRRAMGMTMWLETMVETAIAATITMDVADENPPRNANSASSSRSAERGSVSTYKSGSDPTGVIFKPVTAIGTMNRLIPNRYRGNSQEAVRKWRSSMFSTTVT